MPIALNYMYLSEFENIVVHKRKYRLRLILSRQTASSIDKRNRQQELAW